MLSGGRVLVTGAGGFTGRYVTAALAERGCRVSGLGRCAEAGVDLVCDVLDTARLTELIGQVAPTHVVHLAAVAAVDHPDVETIYRVNLLGTRSLLAALEASGCTPRAVLLASSANVYGHTSADPVDETTPPCPANDYAVSKLAMEQVARLWQDRLPIIVARPFNYTGVGQSEAFVLAKIVAHFARGESSIRLGNLEVERDFSDVRVVAEAYVRLLEAAPAGGLFNVCSGRAVSVREVLALMTAIAGRSIDVHSDPALQRARDIRRQRGSAARLQAAIGPLPAIALEQTLRWMYAAARQASGGRA